jgi:hypothetical protein
MSTCQSIENYRRKGSVQEWHEPKSDRRMFFEAACYVPLARNLGERSAALLESFHTRSDRLLPEERPEEVWIAKSSPASKTNDDKVLRGRNINALTVRADHGYEVGRRVL